ncbi:hypothetical protein Dda_5816 [Drechslerella dactyloides]|uniref:Uncharacterized protein n=1 Tax=Drechslerella dactyloides TaxID=74499 RepID=A0AAD6IUZ9_DREDA|nr:hypothetical protein Dda_5816 [Drechslerella dactyloides]
MYYLSDEMEGGGIPPSRRSSDAGRSSYVHFTHHGLATGANTAPSSARNSMYDFPSMAAASGYATTAAGGGGGGPSGGGTAWPWPAAAGMKRYSLMPTKGKDWARSKKDMRWDPKFCGMEKRIKRVLMVEYFKSEVYEGGRRFIKMEAKATEASDMAAIDMICRRERPQGIVLRVFHVQNFPEAIEFFVAKYRMHDRKDVEGWDGMKDWVYRFRPQRRAGKAVPMAKTFKKRQIPGLAKVAWGMDCLKVMRVGYRPDDKKERHPDTKVAELKGFLEDRGDVADDGRGGMRAEDPWLDEMDDERSPSPHWNETDPNNPRVAHHTHDVYSQRLTVYMQWVTNEVQKPAPVPSDDRRRKAVELFDPGSTIVVIDNSESLSIEDTIVPAHGEIERIWRGPGTSYYEIGTEEEANELTASGSPNTKFARDFVQRIVETIYNSVADCWEAVLDVAWDHESILQDSIYEHPADESRAPELFKNSETWLKFSKLMSYHLECIGDVQEYVGDFRDEDESNDSDTAVYTWLRSVEQTFLRLNGYIEEDLIKQTDKLTDLMYKTVGIRDSQDSLRLGTSMWRLSWVTFIFLPLSFITSFFGMNVDLFQDNPAIKWYFITAAPFMAVVIIAVFMLKWFIDRHRRPIYERAVYERLFNELQQANADLWSSHGPREVQPIGWTSKLKWYIIYKFTKNKTTYRGTSIEYDSIWSRCKQYLIRRWSPDIAFKPQESDWIIDNETGEVRRGRRNSLQHRGTLINMGGVMPGARRVPTMGPSRGVHQHAASTTAGSVSQPSLRSTSATSRVTQSHGEKSETLSVPASGQNRPRPPRLSIERPSSAPAGASQEDLKG